MDYALYSRQLILAGFGVEGQRALGEGSCVVVGAGGLGCPALTYLGLSGVGRLTVIDEDVVEVSNLARQSLHDRASVGTPKAVSAKAALGRLAPGVEVRAVVEAVTAANALELLSGHTLIVDCSDNPATRYLLSDAAVVLGVPLVSGAGQQYEGQLAVYNYNGGPCLRCVFPRPPAPQFAPSCADVGILGPVVGTIGTLQALEAVKIIANLAPADAHPHMLLFSALALPPFRSIKLRNRKPDCIAHAATSLDIANTDYIQLCGGPRPDWESLGTQVRDPTHRIPARTLAQNLPGATILDVRPPTEFGICRIEGSINIPLPSLLASPREVLDRALAGSRDRALAGSRNRALDSLSDTATPTTSSSSDSHTPNHNG